MAIPDPPKAGSPFCVLQTGGFNPKTPEINNFFIPEITIRGGYRKNPGSDFPGSDLGGSCNLGFSRVLTSTQEKPGFRFPGF